MRIRCGLVVVLSVLKFAKQRVKSTVLTVRATVGLKISIGSLAQFLLPIAHAFPSLEIGSSTHYKAIRSADLVQLTATITKPSALFAVWPERYFGPALAAGMPDVSTRRRGIARPR